jgi:hypothetical protein
MHDLEVHKHENLFDLFTNVTKNNGGVLFII